MRGYDEVRDQLDELGYLGDLRVLVDVAVEAEAAGWDAVFVSDHVNWRDAGFHVDPWIALGLIADRTSRVLIGTAVTPVPRRRPTKLAREILTLHALSGGRFIFGAGSGLWNSEFADLGDERDMKIRAGMLDEGLELLKKTFHGEPLDHEGTYYRAKGQPFVSGSAEIPIRVGASWPSHKPMRRAARFDGVMAMSRDYRHPLSPGDVREMSRFIEAHRDSEAPFNLGVALSASDDLAADADRAHTYSEAGADWWQEGVYPPAENLEKLRTIVRAPARYSACPGAQPMPQAPPVMIATLSVNTLTGVSGTDGPGLRRSSTSRSATHRRPTSFREPSDGSSASPDVAAIRPRRPDRTRRCLAGRRSTESRRQGS